MDTLPQAIIAVLRPFEGTMSERVWEWAKLLVVGAILAPGQRTVTGVLRVLGQSSERQFQNDQRVLNRACWSSRALSRTLLLRLVDTFAPVGAPLMLGIDDTLSRRRGATIAAKGIYRDPVRSSKGHVVRTSGRRWISMQLLVPVPWAKRVWALPFLTVLAPSERSAQQRGQRHKTRVDWGGQMMRPVRRWLPDRALVVVADSTYAALDLVAAAQGLRQPVPVITRLRLDAALFDPAPARQGRTQGRPRVKGARQPTLAQRLADPATVWEPVRVPWCGGDPAPAAVELATGTAVWYHAGLPPVALRWVLLRSPAAPFEPQALLATDTAAPPVQIVGWFVLRWQLEVTFHELRAHLGVETQRHWSDLAILRTTPALFGLFSVVTLCAHHLLQGQELPQRQAAWYPKALPTFTDTLALVCGQLWPATLFATSPAKSEMVEIPRALFDRLTDTLAFAA